MGILEIIEQQLKGEAQQMQAEIEKQLAGKKGGRSQLTSEFKRLKGKIRSRVAEERLRQKLDQGD